MSLFLLKDSRSYALFFQASSWHSEEPPRSTPSARKRSPVGDHRTLACIFNAASFTYGSSSFPSTRYGGGSNRSSSFSDKSPNSARTCRRFCGFLASELHHTLDLRRSKSICSAKVRWYSSFNYTGPLTACAGIMSATTLVLCLVAPINALLHFFFVHRTSLGLMGAPLALSFTYWIMFILICVYTALSPTRKRNNSWVGFDLAAVLDPGSSWRFLKLALPGILMVGTECSYRPT
jgi:hypothetical protein